MFITESSSRAVRRFGIDDNREVCENRGGRHAVLFVAVDVTVILGVGNNGGNWDGRVERKYKSQIKYSDKKARVPDSSLIN